MLRTTREIRVLRSFLSIPADTKKFDCYDNGDDQRTNLIRAIDSFHYEIQAQVVKHADPVLRKILRSFCKMADFNGLVASHAIVSAHDSDDLRRFSRRFNLYKALFQAHHHHRDRESVSA